MQVRLYLSIFLLAAISLLWPSAPVARADEPLAKFSPDEVIISLHPDHRLTASGRLYTTLGREIRAGLHPAVLSVESLDNDGAVHLVHLRSGSNVQEAVALLNGNPAVRYAEPNYVRTVLRKPNDAAYSQQWALRKISAPQAWDITGGSDQIVIALLDTGVSLTHEDLHDKLLPGYNATNGSSDSSDVDGHGTYTAGVAAASTNNNVGIAGTCWQCKILPIRVFDERGRAESAYLIRGIRHAVDRGARILSMSLGGDEYSRAEEEAVNYAHNKGALIIAAAGNSAKEGNPTIYPAAFDHVVAVAATTNIDQVTGFSSHGSYVDIAAPGVGIWSTIREDGKDTYGVENGTSASCPHVAGVAGLVLSLWPGLNPDQLAQILLATTDDLGEQGKDDYYGYGRLNALRAVEAARDQRIPAFPQPPQPPQPQPSSNAAFAPVPPPSDPNVAYFPETSHTLRGAFKEFWERNGGLPVFGYPISEEFTEETPNGVFVVQYFERERFEYHPENAPPYHVLLGRLGDSTLLDQGRNWFTFPKGQPTSGCRYFEQTGHSLCEPFLSYWRNHGLQLDGQPGLSEPESLALFGLPLSEPQMETNASGKTVLTQWFERARFEYHPNNPPEHQVLLGLLGNELASRRGWR